MKVLVCLEPRRAALNPGGLALAVRLAETEIVVVSALEANPIAPWQAESRLIQIAEPSLVQAHPRAAAEVVAAVVKREAPDHVLTGLGAGGAFAAALAAALDWPYLPQVSDLERCGESLHVWMEAAAERLCVRPLTSTVFGCVPRELPPGPPSACLTRVELTREDLGMPGPCSGAPAEEWSAAPVPPKAKRVKSAAALWDAMDARRR